MGLEEMAAGPTTHFQDSQGTTGPKGRDTGHWSHKGQHRHLRGVGESQAFRQPQQPRWVVQKLYSGPIFCILPFDPQELTEGMKGC